MNYINIVKRNIRRTPYQALAALMVMIFTFLTLSVSILLGSGSQQILRFYESKPQAIVFFKDGTTDADVEAIKNSLNQTEKITDFKYVSKEDALQIYRERNKDNPMLLELVTANILPASLEISTKAPEDLKFIAEIVRKEPVAEDVVFPEDVVLSLTRATTFIRTIGMGVAGFLLIFSLLIIMMIIGFKIRIKRDEIEIMKLLGASNWFIRIPYLIEGVVYSAAGAFIGWLASLALIWYFEPLLISSLGEIAPTLFPLSPLLILEILLLELILAVLVGIAGSLIAVRRYLHL
ncbi:MAG: FtsX-like permease family protein [Armatimonadetes bacterium]|nr:MAG: FtsX-like permease family protein [Armatimonadota bacterium]